MADNLASESTLAQRRFLLEQIESRLRVQFDELDGLDRKATTVLAATGVTLGLVINNAGSISNSPAQVGFLFYTALVVLAAGLVQGILALWPRRIQVVPDPGPFLEQHQTSPLEFIIGELVSTKALAFAINHPIPKLKGDRVRIQMVLLAIGGTLLVASYVVERLA
jgi:hypothetical protein